MDFRMADYKDIDDIMNIIFKAQENFRNNKIDQWQNNYPNDDIIREDIKNKNSYVLLKDGIIIGTVYLSFDEEPTYKKIYKGQWLSNGKYAVIHRMAVDSEYKGLGLASLMMKYVEDICLNKNIHSIKVDTHSENLSMQRSLEKNGYRYCGIIYLEDGNERVAFEKLLLN